MKAAALLAAAAVLALAPAVPAAAESQRMTLDCGGQVGLIERTNGSSWWGVDDGAVYTTKYLRVIDNQGNDFEKHYGHTAKEHVECVAAHDVPAEDYQSTWTVHLVMAR